MEMGRSMFGEVSCLEERMPWAVFCGVAPLAGAAAGVPEDRGSE